MNVGELIAELSKHEKHIPVCFVDTYERKEWGVIDAYADVDLVECKTQKARKINATKSIENPEFVLGETGEYKILVLSEDLDRDEFDEDGGLDI